MVYQDLVPHESEREGGKVVGYISYRSTLIHITRQPPIIKIRALLLLFSDNIANNKNISSIKGVFDVCYARGWYWYRPGVLGTYPRPDRSLVQY